jgi:hypothetical protein
MTGIEHLSWIEKEAQRDYIKPSQKGGEMATLIGIILVTFFFYAHQAGSTGFFTPSFGALVQFLFYSSIVTGMLGPITRMATGRRNAARPPELVASIFWIVASIWLLIVFPFNFAHFADVIPDSLGFLVSWVTNEIARILIILGTLGGVVFAGINALLYVKVKAILESGRYALAS